VEKRLLDPGTYVNVFPTGGVPVVKIVDLAQVDAVIDVPEALLPHLADEPQVTIASAVCPEIRAEAEIISVGRVADRASGTYQLRARIANPDHRFRGAMVVTAEIVKTSSRRAIQIPLTAVCHAFGQPPYVLLVEPEADQVIAREVRLGPVAGELVEIPEGLASGDLLIVRGQHQAVEGDRVRYERIAFESIARTERRSR
jgi:membrane fusion protein (multidrug efflux system)